MGKRRGADERRGTLRGLAEEAREEFRRMERSDTGGQERASRAEREGTAPARAGRQAAGEDVERATREGPKGG